MSPPCTTGSTFRHPGPVAGRARRHFATSGLSDTFGVWPRATVEAKGHFMSDQIVHAGRAAFLSTVICWSSQINRCRVYSNHRPRWLHAAHRSQDRLCFDLCACVACEKFMAVSRVEREYAEGSEYFPLKFEQLCE